MYAMYIMMNADKCIIEYDWTVEDCNQTRAESGHLHPKLRRHKPFCDIYCIFYIDITINKFMLHMGIRMQSQ